MPGVLFKEYGYINAVSDRTLIADIAAQDIKPNLIKSGGTYRPIPVVKGKHLREHSTDQSQASQFGKPWATSSYRMSLAEYRKKSGVRTYDDQGETVRDLIPPSN